MNRPRLNYNKIKANLDGKQLKVKIDLSKFGYLLELERYCDELEKALNKACEHLNEMECAIIGSKEHTWGKDQWKEWAMKED